MGPGYGYPHFPDKEAEVLDGWMARLIPHSGKCRNQDEEPTSCASAQLASTLEVSLGYRAGSDLPGAQEVTQVLRRGRGGVSELSRQLAPLQLGLAGVGPETCSFQLQPPLQGVSRFQGSWGRRGWGAVSLNSLFFSPKVCPWPRFPPKG